MTKPQKVRALRRVLSAVMQAEADCDNDPISRYYGITVAPPRSIYMPVARALLQLRLSRAEAVMELDTIIRREGQHEENGNPPLAWYQLMVLEDE